MWLRIDPDKALFRKFTAVVRGAENHHKVVLRPSCAANLTPIGCCTLHTYLSDASAASAFHSPNSFRYRRILEASTSMPIPLNRCATSCELREGSAQSHWRTNSFR